MSLTISMLHMVYAGADAPKRMARDAGVSHRTTEKWWACLTTPRADVLLRMAQKNEALRAEMLRALEGPAYADLVGTSGPEARPVVAPDGGVADAAEVAAPGGEGRR